MRISDNQIYASAMNNMNESLDRLMQLNMQSSAQKKLLRPSDNPSGMATVLDLSAHNGALDHFLKNVKTAQGWLNLSDNVLGEVSKTVIKIKELAQQASTETYTYDQRMAIGSQLRELLGTLVNQANTQFAGKSIFAGHKVDQEPFTPIPGATVLDETLTDTAVESVTGDAAKVMQVQFTDSGTIGGATDIGYRFTTNAGKTWTTGTLIAGQRELTLNGCKVTLQNGIAVTETNTAPGTRINIRPSVQYLGDDADGTQVRNLSQSPLLATTLGHFDSSINVRLDNAGTLPGPISYSFSLNGGATWTTGNTSSNASLPIPGGSLNLASAAGNTFASGAQFSVSPNTADISLSISRTQSVTVNTVGKDVFGGMYRKPGETLLSKAMHETPDKNLFETVGELIGFVETNDTDNIGKSLEKISVSHAHVEGVNGTIGARVNLTDFVMNTLTLRKDNNTTYMSNIESADAAELMAEIKKSEFIYSSVVRTNQLILGLNSMSLF